MKNSNRSRCEREDRGKRWSLSQHPKPNKGIIGEVGEEANSGQIWWPATAHRKGKTCYRVGERERVPVMVACPLSGNGEDRHLCWFKGTFLSLAN